MGMSLDSGRQIGKNQRIPDEHVFFNEKKPTWDVPKKTWIHHWSEGILW